MAGALLLMVTESESLALPLWSSLADTVQVMTSPGCAMVAFKVIDVPDPMVRPELDQMYVGDIDSPSSSLTVALQVSELVVVMVPVEEIAALLTDGALLSRVIESEPESVVFPSVTVTAH